MTRTHQNARQYFSSFLQPAKSDKQAVENDKEAVEDSDNEVIAWYHLLCQQHHICCFSEGLKELICVRQCFMFLSHASQKDGSYVYSMEDGEFESDDDDDKKS